MEKNFQLSFCKKNTIKIEKTPKKKVLQKLKIKNFGALLLSLILARLTTDNRPALTMGCSMCDSPSYLCDYVGWAVTHSPWCPPALNLIRDVLRTCDYSQKYKWTIDKNKQILNKWIKLTLSPHLLQDFMQAVLIKL